MLIIGGCTPHASQPGSGSAVQPAPGSGSAHPRAVRPSRSDSATPVPQPTPSDQPPKAGAPLSISGRFIVDAAGRTFIPRGPELVTADPGQQSDIDAIAATGANAMRMLLTIDTANNMTPEKFDQLIGRAVSKKMVVGVSGSGRGSSN